MSRIDKNKPFIPIRMAVLTVSDSRTMENDKSGARLAELLTAAGHHLAAREIVTDDVGAIAASLRKWCVNPDIDVVLTTGGTGLTGRDVTPEALRMVMEKEIEGFGELFRWISYDKIGTSTMQSRAMGALAQGTYIFALPGSPSACRDAWHEILRFQLDSRLKPCNLVELMPRLREHLN